MSKAASSSTPGKMKKVIRAISADECTERLARLSKGISHPVRLEIVRMLAHNPPGDECICGRIVEALPLAQSSVSQHLKILRETGWITAEPRGKSVRYCLVDGIFDTYRNLMDSAVIYT
jgi:DNA-binding transcriptional ArsR family regulator